MAHGDKEDDSEAVDGCEGGGKQGEEKGSGV